MDLRITNILQMVVAHDNAEIVNFEKRWTAQAKSEDECYVRQQKKVGSLELIPTGHVEDAGRICIANLPEQYNKHPSDAAREEDNLATLEIWIDGVLTQEIPKGEASLIYPMQGARLEWRCGNGKATKAHIQVVPRK